MIKDIFRTYRIIKNKYNGHHYRKPKDRTSEYQQGHLDGYTQGWIKNEDITKAV